VLDVRLPAAATGAAVCERAGADGVFTVAPRAEAAGDESTFDAAAATRVRLVRSRSGARLADGPRAVDSRNDISWGPADCRLVASFAIGRSQQLVYLLRTLMAAGRIPEVPIWIDSPMAVDAMEVFRRHVAEHDFSEAAMAGVAESLASPFVHMAKTANESKAINARGGPGIVIASSGMMNGGRILHHLTQRLPDPKTTVLVAGFQAAGTRGRSLIDGADTLRIHGRDIPVRAAVRRVDALSGHADRREIGRWLADLPAPKRTFLVHGEPPAARGMAEFLGTTLHFETTIPAIGDAFELA
jgi:metallo-beta-lactamase family protein